MLSEEEARQIKTYQHVTMREGENCYYQGWIYAKFDLDEDTCPDDNNDATNRPAVKIKTV